MEVEKLSTAMAQVLSDRVNAGEALNNSIYVAAFTWIVSFVIYFIKKILSKNIIYKFNMRRRFYDCINCRIFYKQSDWK